MSNDELFPKWSPFGPNALLELSKCMPSSSIHQLEATALSSQIQKMPGVAFYFAKPYSMPVTIGSTDTFARGEFVVVRRDQEMWKAYNFVFGSSRDDRLYFNGPYKNFTEHHFKSTSEVSLESLFGHIPGTTKSSL